MANLPTQRPARPGEVCPCGRPATFVYVFDEGRHEVPYCGIPDGGRVPEGGGEPEGGAR